MGKHKKKKIETQKEKYKIPTDFFQKRMDSTSEDELLVFGYGCKLFRDDEKALLVEEGHYSVPWMGDHSLQIDRFDARGNLTKLENHEALGQELKKEEYMAPDEIKTE